MGWENNKITERPVFDVELPEMDFSLDSVFGELKTHLKEERVRKDKKVRKRYPKKSKNITEERTTLKSVSDIASKLNDLEKRYPTITEKTNDPLALANTPKYMTQSEFQNHYRLLLDRIQIQLSSLGGGGAVNIRDMDDVDTTFITDPQSLDGATMKMGYDPVQKILKFYGDNTTLLDQRTIAGTADINVDFFDNEFTISLSESISLPGTLVTAGITTLSTNGGETSTGGDLRVTGTARATKFTTTSDERLKKNINQIPNAVDVIANMNGVTFDWIADGSSDVGVIAQDVERVLPDAVIEVNGYKTVNYNGIIGALVEAVKELSKDNIIMGMEIEKIKNTMNS